jgi:hypothetical protein
MPQPTASQRVLLTTLRALIEQCHKANETDLAFDLDQTFGHYVKRYGLNEQTIRRPDGRPYA